MTIEKAIFYLLIECGIYPTSRGFAYLQDAIVLCYKDEDKMYLITKVLYPEIAKRHGTSPTAVERAIRYAIHNSKSEHRANSKFIASAVWFLNQLDRPLV